jgi:RNA polymerase sigma factor (TIGR02999 family)
MTESAAGKVTAVLAAIGQGDEGASDELLPLVYEELRRLARARMAHEGPQTLQPTALVHEAYLRLVGDNDPQWQSRGHFFAAAAEAMRRILIERARRVARPKHGGDRRFVELDADTPSLSQPRPEELLAIDQALERLERRDPEMAAVVKLRFFAGMTEVETARATGRSERTVRRQWTAAKAWLRREMRTER